MGDRGWNTSESAAAEYDWPPGGSTPGRPAGAHGARALGGEHAADDGDVRGSLLEDVAALEDARDAEAGADAVAAPRVRVESGAGGAIHALDVRAHGGLRVHDEALEVVELDAVRVDIEGE